MIHVLATWYIAYILTAQNGPFSILARLRALPVLHDLLQCIYCAAPYVAVGVYAVGGHEGMGYPIIQVIAIAGAALMLRSYTGAGMRDV
jgi:hypothetical protein